MNRDAPAETCIISSITIIWHEVYKLYSGNILYHWIFAVYEFKFPSNHLCLSKETDYETEKKGNANLEHCKFQVCIARVILVRVWSNHNCITDLCVQNCWHCVEIEWAYWLVSCTPFVRALTPSKSCGEKSDFRMIVLLQILHLPYASLHKRTVTTQNALIPSSIIVIHLFCHTLLRTAVTI